MAPFMDRDKVTKATAQIGFIKFVLIPMFETVTKVSGCHHVLDGAALRNTHVCTRSHTHTSVLWLPPPARPEHHLAPPWGPPQPSSLPAQGNFAFGRAL